MERAEKRKQVVVYQSLHVQFVNTMIQVAVRSKYNSEPLVLLSFLDITVILKFFSKLEEKQQALEAEKTEWEARTRVHFDTPS